MSETNPVDSQLWQACAGPTVSLPPVNSFVFYILRGHADHANCPADFPLPPLPALVLCQVAGVQLLADSRDEVFAKISLVPVLTPYSEIPGDDGDEASSPEELELCCAKVLTQSDANNGGGFSVPKRCADKILPPLNYAVEPPVQDLNPVDIHGQPWRFRHIYRGTPRRHLFTSGWTKFVNEKQLVAGDCIVFVRSAAERAAIRVGIRRFKRRRTENSARVTPADVLSTAALVAAGKPFEVVYEPCGRSGGKAAEFVVKAKKVTAALCRVLVMHAGMKFTMSFEDSDDPSRFKSSKGNFVSVDLLRWPFSPWKALQVTWEESENKPENLSHVSPWEIEVETVEAPPVIDFSLSGLPEIPQILSLKRKLTASSPEPGRTETGIKTKTKTIKIFGKHVTANYESDSSIEETESEHLDSDEQCEEDESVSDDEEDESVSDDEESEGGKC